MNEMKLHPISLSVTFAIGLLLLLPLRSLLKTVLPYKGLLRLPAIEGIIYSIVEGKKKQYSTKQVKDLVTWCIDMLHVLCTPQPPLRRAPPYRV